jgi:hypothetical protein
MLLFQDRFEAQIDVTKIKLPTYTARHLLGLVDTQQRAAKGEPVFMFPDERAMQAAQRRGLAAKWPDGWVLTDACYEWARWYPRRHLRLIRGGV